MNTWKRILTALASAFGLSAHSTAQDVQMVSPKDLLYSLATIEDVLPELSESIMTGKNPLVLSEDDWRQFEFVSKSHRKELNQELASIDTIFREQSVDLKEGWRAFKKTHVRSLIRSPVLPNLAWEEFIKTLGPEAVSRSAVTFRGASSAVKDGFAIDLGPLTFYGIRNGEGITTLCLEVAQAKPPLPGPVAEKLAAYFDGAGLLLVHWTSRTPLESLAKLRDYFAGK